MKKILITGVLIAGLVLGVVSPSINSTSNLNNTSGTYTVSSSSDPGSGGR